MTDTPDLIAKECFKKHAVYPISFCLPRQKLRPFRQKPKVKNLSFIVPGDVSTFVFRDEESYMNEYQVSKFARTRKKAGWDCVRHLEIMASSSLPVFQDIEQCPEHTMIHYPKAMFQEIKAAFEDMAEAQYDALLGASYDWLTQHLISDKMAEYMLRIAGADGAEKILFIDGALPKKPDCQSVMILSGLKNKFGSRCEVAYPLECLYAGRPVPTKPRWWKTNFNLYQVLDDAVRSPNEKAPDIRGIEKKISAREYDLIIYGSITRSGDLFELVTANYAKEKVFCINGDDDYRRYPAEVHVPWPKRIKQLVRRRLERNRRTGPQMDPALHPIAQWRKLLAEIQPKSTVFMRELLV